MTAQPLPGSQPSTPPRSPDPSKGSRAWPRWLLLAVCALLGFVPGVGYFALPGLLTEKVEAGLIQRAEKRGLLLKIGKTWFDPLRSLTLDGLEVRDAQHPDAAPVARIGRLRVDYELDGVLSPRVYLQTVLLDSPDVYVRRGPDGVWNIQTLLDKLLKPKADDDDEGGGGLRKYLSKHLPDVDMRQLRVAVDDDSGKAPATLAGLDLRHVRVSEASLSLRNTSPVAERQHVEMKAQARVAGIAKPVELLGVVDRAADQKDLGKGELTLKLPDELAVDVGGWRAQVGQVTARTDGAVALGHVQLAQTTGLSQFALDIQEIAIKLSPVAGPELVLPEELAAKLPTLAKPLLRRVTEVTIVEPVIVSKRQERAKDAPGADDDDEDAPLNTPPEDARKGAKKAGLAGKGKAGAKPLDVKQKEPPKGPDPAEGSAVRHGLATAFSAGADKLERQLAKLRQVMASIPVPLITVQRGRARFHDEQTAQNGQARELSDFSAKLERKPGDDVARLDLTFHTPGRQETNQLEGRVDIKTGDVELKLQLEHLPLAPYAAVLPPSLTPGEQGAIRNLALTVLYTSLDSKAKAGDRAGQLTLDGHGRVEHIHADITRISRQRLEDLNVEAHGKLVVDLRKEEIKLDDAELVLGKTHVVAQAAVKKFRTAPAFSLSAKVPTVPCQDVVDSLPRGFAPLLEGLTCEGSLSAEGKIAVDTANMNSLKLEWEPALSNVRITSMGRYIRFDIFDAPFEHHARQKDGSLYTFVTGPGSDMWAPMENINPYFIKVLTTTEDGGFFGHKGFSWESFKGAAIANLKAGRFVRGASTITQQLVKNLFFVEREKTISRKIQEAVVTWQIERSLTKQHMMSLYLNIIELGPKIYGIRAATQHYFNRPPSELTLLQSIWLGNLVPNPRAFYHQYRDGKVSDGTKTTLCWIGDVMLKRTKITEEERKRLGDCSGVFGPDVAPVEPGTDGGFGHEGDADLGGAPPPPPILQAPPPPAPVPAPAPKAAPVVPPKTGDNQIQ